MYFKLEDIENDHGFSDFKGLYHRLIPDANML